MGTVAERQIRTVLALTEKGIAILFSDKRFRSEVASFVRPITEGLISGVTAGAEKVGLSFFESNFGGGLRGYSGIRHDV